MRAEPALQLLWLGEEGTSCLSRCTEAPNTWRAALLQQCAGGWTGRQIKVASAGACNHGTVTRVSVVKARHGTIALSGVSCWPRPSPGTQRPAARRRAPQQPSTRRMPARASPVPTAGPAACAPGGAAPAAPSAPPGCEARAPWRLSPAAAAPREASVGQRGQASGGCSRRCCCRWRWTLPRPRCVLKTGCCVARWRPWERAIGVRRGVREGGYPEERTVRERVAPVGPCRVSCARGRAAWGRPIERWGAAVQMGAARTANSANTPLVPRCALCSPTERHLAIAVVRARVLHASLFFLLTCWPALMAPRIQVLRLSSVPGEAHRAHMHSRPEIPHVTQNRGWGRLHTARRRRGLICSSFRPGACPALQSLICLLSRCRLHEHAARGRSGDVEAARGHAGVQRRGMSALSHQRCLLCCIQSQHGNSEAIQRHKLRSCVNGCSPATATAASVGGMRTAAPAGRQPCPCCPAPHQCARPQCSRTLGAQTPLFSHKRGAGIRRAAAAAWRAQRGRAGPEDQPPGRPPSQDRTDRRHADQEVPAGGLGGGAGRACAGRVLGRPALGPAGPVPAGAASRRRG